MKVGIICFWDRLASPYLSKYEEILKIENVEYETIFWDRNGFDKQSVTKISCEKYIDIKAGNGKFGKIIAFLKWRKQINNLLRTENYDGLIILTTHPAVLLYPTLMGKYRNKYIFDIRDYTHEKYKIYRKLVLRLIEASSLTTISSKGFMRWLVPSEKIIPNHNITISEEIEKLNFNFNKIPIRFSFVGNVRLDKQTVALMLTLSKSQRYYMRFVGRVLPSCSIEKIIYENKIKNVSVEGEFNVNQKSLIYSETDLINAVYANASKKLSLGDSTPIPNRLYDSIIFKCPIIASKGTYLAELVDMYHLGLAINGFDSNAEEQIDSYLEKFDPVTFVNGCKSLLGEVKAEEQVFRQKIRSVLVDWRTEQYDS